MKKLIALGAALMVLLFSFMPSMNVADTNEGIQVCSDLEAKPYPYD